MEPRSEIRRTGQRDLSREKPIVARASISVSAPRSNTWDALVNPETIRKYMFGARVVSDWKTGSPITWEGEWKGKPFWRMMLEGLKKVLEEA